MQVEFIVQGRGQGFFINIDYDPQMTAQEIQDILLKKADITVEPDEEVWIEVGGNRLDGKSTVGEYNPYLCYALKIWKPPVKTNKPKKHKARQKDIEATS